MMSVRGSSPKISSLSVTDPAALPSRLVTFSSMSRALLLGQRGWRVRTHLGLRQAELPRFRRVLRQRLFHRIAHHDPAALGAGHRALDQNEAALDVRLNDFQIQRGHPFHAHVAGHLLVLERLAGILATTGRADRTVRDRHAVRGTQAAEIPALHAAGEPLADRGTRHIDELTNDEMVGGNLGADWDHRVLAHAKLGDFTLGLDFGNGETSAFGLGDVLHLAAPGAELQRQVSVLLLGAMTQDLTIIEPQHRDRDMLAGLREDPRHPDFLCDHSGTCRHCPDLSRPRSAQSLISTSTPAARSSFMSASTVCGVGSTMSSSRLCVRISNCSRLFLSMCGERLTVNFSIFVGSGIGPRTCAPVRLAVATISRVDASRMR